MKIYSKKGVIYHNKLVRDNIPSIIERSGKTPYTRVLSDAEYKRELYKKLDEEVKEFLSSEDLTELADIEQVIRAIVTYKQYTYADLERRLEEKAVERGVFDERVFLVKVED